MNSNSSKTRKRKKKMREPTRKITVMTWTILKGNAGKGLKKGSGR